MKTESQVMRPHIVKEENSTSIEFIKDNARFLLWSEDGEAGWAFVSKDPLEIDYSGDLDPRIVESFMKYTSSS